MVDALVRSYPIISDQVDKEELRIILLELEKVLTKKVAGDIVEFGCYTGTTSLFIQRLLEGKNSAKTFHVYDSFSGLPEKTLQDQSPVGEQFTAGELRASKREFAQNFQRAGLALPTIHKCWFHEVTDSELPEAISFAYLDGDFYGSIMDSLTAIENRLSSGAVIVVDDYQSEALPGVARAVRDWLKTHTGELRITASLAVIQT